MMKFLMTPLIGSAFPQVTRIVLAEVAVAVILVRGPGTVENIQQYTDYTGNMQINKYKVTTI